MKIPSFAKFLSLLLSVLLIFNLAFVGVSAVENTAEYMIYLDISNTDWSAEKGVYCHIWNVQTGEIYNEWSSNAERMTVSEYGETILEFDLSTAIADFEDSQKKIYGLIFGSADGSQTYTIVMSGYCYNECVYLTQDTNNKKLYFGEFCGFSYDYGTHLTIDASNRVYGHALFENETSSMLLANHMVEKVLYGSETLDKNIINQLLVDVQATISDTKKAIEATVNSLISEKAITQEQGTQFKTKIYTVLNSCTNPKLKKNIYFDVFYSGWNPSDTFYCHVWSVDDTGIWNEWRSDAEICEYDKAGGVAIYDLNKTGNDISGSDKKYFVMFGSSSGEVSPYATMNGNCVGDSAYVATYWEEYSDTEYIHLFWEKSTDCGPIKQIGDDGEIIGFSLPYGTTDEMLLSEYLIKNFAKLSVDTVQSLVDILEVTSDSIKSQVTKDLKGTDGEILKQIVDILDQCKFSENIHLIGDVNDDGIVNVVDATALAKHLAEIDYIDSEMLKYADVNGDSVISIMDVTQIQKISAGIV